MKQFLAAPPADAFVQTIALAHYWLGKIAEKRGAKDLAREQYQAALTLDPKSPLIRTATESIK